jgi:hypothetical protein
MIDLQKFSSKLNECRSNDSSTSPSSPGLPYVIRYIWNQYHSSDIDFDSFTFDDCIQALDALSEIPPTDDDDEEPSSYRFEEMENAFAVYNLLEDVCYDLHKFPLKQYDNDDDFI